MKPYDIIGGNFDDFSNNKAIEFWNQCYSDINGKKNNLTLDEIVCLYKKLAYLKK